MIEQINISNSKLRLVKVDFNSTTKLAIIPDISKLRLRKVFYFDRETVGSYPTCITGLNDKMHLDYKQAWVIEKTNEKFGKLSYTSEEKDIMAKTVLSFVLCGSLNRKISEIILNAIGDAELIEIYEKSAASKNVVNDFYSYLSKEDRYKTSDSYSISITGEGYTVYELLNDLVKDKSYICISSEVMGEYIKMSRSRVDRRKAATIISDKWFPILKVFSKKDRANLSLLFSSKVSVNIPENTFGEPSGPRELTSLSSFCIIRDGRVWTKKLVVKVNSSELQKKLSHCKANVGNLVYSNEFILDISKLPIIKSSQVKVSSFQLAQLEISEKLLGVNEMYYRRLIFLKKSGKKVLAKGEYTKEPVSEREGFLHSLGIYGNSYCPMMENDKVKYEYSPVAIESTIHGFPTQYRLYEGVREFINTGNTAKSEYLNSYLKTVDVSSKPLEELLEDTIRKRAMLSDQVKIAKFKLGLDKRYKFYEHGSPSVDGKSNKYCTHRDLSTGDLKYLSIQWTVFLDDVTV